MPRKKSETGPAPRGAAPGLRHTNGAEAGHGDVLANRLCRDIPRQHRGGDRHESAELSMPPSATSTRSISRRWRVTGRTASPRRARRSRRIVQLPDSLMAAV